MREFFGVMFGGALGYVVAIAIAALLGLGIYWFVAPRQMQIQSEVFHNSQQYNDGMNVELEHYRESFALCKSDKACQATVRSIVVEEYATYPESKLNPDLVPFLDQMRSGN